MRATRFTNVLAFAALALVVVLAAPMALGRGPGGGGGGETGVNNLSFPVILSDNATPGAFPLDGAWRFASITDPLTQCIGEEGVTPGTPVPPEYLCYYGRQVIVVSETGEIQFVVGDPKVWWLQKRTQNFWKTLSVGHDVSTPLVVSAVDVGDLLESSPSIATRQIRVEFNLLQSVPADSELAQYVVTGWSNPVPDPCVVPTATGQSLGCFAALGMSGAVPGTEQSGNETQGTDFGPGPASTVLSAISGTHSSAGRGHLKPYAVLEAADPVPGTQTLVDPSTVRLTEPDVGGIQALVYSRCARLLIQKIDGTPAWDPETGQWAGPSVGAPLVNVAAYTDDWPVEITSGGSIVYGYNWNAKTASTGTYRLTMVLDGNDEHGPQCTTTLATKFVRGSTQLVNVGTANPAEIIYAGESGLGDEGGIAYLDLTLTAKGGGGGGGGHKGGR